MFSSWVFLHRYFLTILIMVTEQLYWRKILDGCFRSLWLWLLVAIMNRCAEWCALQLYRTSLTLMDYTKPCFHQFPSTLIHFHPLPSTLTHSCTIFNTTRHTLREWRHNLVDFGTESQILKIRDWNSDIWHNLGMKYLGYNTITLLKLIIFNEVIIWSHFGTGIWSLITHH